MFWNGKKLESKISELIELDNSADIKTVKVDCASIELTVGSEVYITPSSENDPKVKRILTEKKSQFIMASALDLALPLSFISDAEFQVSLQLLTQ
ncbi:hypothetical protein, partial [uncultured Acinetobacter sp.]|uniref:hypothetical protein n=1 Tax=uncultured Acinetobacter sp. TaxID=165433 RepID=UPI00260E27DA